MFAVRRLDDAERLREARGERHLDELAFTSQTTLLPRAQRGMTVVAGPAQLPERVAEARHSRPPEAVLRSVRMESDCVAGHTFL